MFHSSIPKETLNGCFTVYWNSTEQHDHFKCTFPILKFIIISSFGYETCEQTDGEEQSSPSYAFILCLNPFLAYKLMQL
jgi:hypothetical protein